MEKLVYDRKKMNFQKNVLFIAVFLLAATIGVLWLGWLSTFIVLVIFAVFTFYSLRISPFQILKWHKAVPLSRYAYTELYQIVDDLARGAQLEKAPQLFLIKSKAINAFALGNKQQSAIGVTHKLMQVLTRDELAAVLAHEISHIKNNDLLVKGLAVSFGRFTHGLSLVGRILLILSIPMYLIGYPLFSLAPVLFLVFSPLLNVLLQMGISRRMEFAADHDAAELTRDPLALASALEKIEKLRRPWWTDFYSVRYNSMEWLKSHPGTKKRVEKLQRLAAKYRKSGQNIYRQIFTPFGWQKVIIRDW